MTISEMDIATANWTRAKRTLERLENARPSYTADGQALLRTAQKAFNEACEIRRKVRESNNA